MSIKDTFKEWLGGCDVVTIEVINTKVDVENHASACKKFRLISGMPEDDEIIRKLRDAL